MSSIITADKKHQYVHAIVCNDIWLHTRKKCTNLPIWESQCSLLLVSNNMTNMVLFCNINVIYCKMETLAVVNILNNVHLFFKSSIANYIHIRSLHKLLRQLLLVLYPICKMYQKDELQLLMYRQLSSIYKLWSSNRGILSVSMDDF